MGMNVNLGTGVNSYATNALPTTAPKYTSQVQASLLSQPAYDTVSFSGNYQTQQKEEGMSTGTKVGLVAAAATLIIGGIAASRGKKLNGEASKGLIDNIGKGLKSMFTKAGRESYKAIVDKADDAAGTVIKKVSSSNVQEAAKNSVGARETLEGLRKQQTELAEQIAKATGDEAKTLQTKLDDLTLKIKDAENPQTLIQEMASKKKAGQDISELQKRLNNISDINIQAADGNTASLMAKQALQGDEAYTKALSEAKELKGKLSTLTAKEASLSQQIIQGEEELAKINSAIKEAKKAGNQTETIKQLNELKREAENALKPLNTQIATLRGTGEGSITAAKKALTDVSTPIGKQYNAKRAEILADIQKDGSSVMNAFKATLGT